MSALDVNPPSVTDCATKWEGLLARWHRCDREIAHTGAHECVCGCTYQPDEPSRCVKCGGPAPFHDPACIVHPGSGEPAQTNRSE